MSKAKRSRKIRNANRRQKRLSRFFTGGRLEWYPDDKPTILTTCDIVSEYPKELTLAG